jgi:hydrogenase maturation protein HypF
MVMRLRKEGFKVYWHQLIPPNDGGISLGQVVSAACRLPLKEKNTKSAL